jgi:L-amino acid N-acyltransferase YncA
MDTRKALPADVEAIADIHIASWQYAYRDIMEDSLLDSIDRNKKVSAWVNGISSLGWLVHVAQEGGHVKGFIHISEYRDADMEEKGVGEVASLYIYPELVGSGVGAMLLCEGLSELEKKGFSKVALWVLEKNERSISFYEKFGFRQDGASKRHPKTGLKEIRYVR